ncbi:nuclear transport factor 2 family protein [Rhodoplanes sp. TEM]|uniref:Nuclear transport factor 2 family protein n=1 Tax=Rhodoplanes tepidamans TaxID=200616 RepID=A0ABT5J7J1_RHOTP|nr:MULTISPECIES: nuclear transport factor 2 family protein [Rhodoplanes]MDC7785620.1 nuclear transport factor 2 family protein [Rhodoplanes tepidamans]MDC7985721.1 nuclear transport factor 2 family protein [Rhodoplanes sp. TEM]MDQ0354814.1 hypothetical protein [Rhodoplanes tepidamans]
MPTISSEQDALDLAKTFLVAIGQRDSAAAAGCLAADAVLIFPGGVRRRDPAAIAAGSATRYRSIGKSIDAWEVSRQGDVFVVYARGTLFGEWPDGTAFSGIRFIDRFEVAPHGITLQEVWNDTGELRPR